MDNIIDIPKKGDDHSSPFFIATMLAAFETERGMEQAELGISDCLRLKTDHRELIIVQAREDILRKISLMVQAGNIGEPAPGVQPELPLNCRSTAKWLMRNDKSRNAEAGMHIGQFMELDEAKRRFEYPIGIEWSTGHKKRYVSPFHEGVILGPVGDDELVFEKLGYSAPYQFSLLSVMEARYADIKKKNRYYLRSFYGAEA